MSQQVFQEFERIKEEVEVTESGRPDFVKRMEGLHKWALSIQFDYLGAIEEEVENGRATDADRTELQKLRDRQWVGHALGEWLGENIYGCWDWLKASHPQK